MNTYEFLGVVRGLPTQVCVGPNLRFDDSAFEKLVNFFVKKWQLHQTLATLSWLGLCRSRRTWGRSAERRTWTLVPARCNRPWTTTTWGVDSTVSFPCNGFGPFSPLHGIERTTARTTARGTTARSPPRWSLYYDYYCPHVAPTARGSRMILRLTQTSAPFSPRILRLVPLSDPCFHPVSTAARPPRV